MVRKRYRRMTAIMMAAVMCSSSLTVQGAENAGEAALEAERPASVEETESAETEAAAETQAESPCQKAQSPLNTAERPRLKRCSAFLA